MTEETAKLKPAMGWVVLWAIVLSELVFAGVGFSVSSGTRETMPAFAIVAMVVGTFTYGLIQCMWMGSVWVVWSLCQWRRGRLRAVVHLLPPIVCLGATLWHLAEQPPSLNTLFRRKFNVDLPADARGIKLHSLLWVDGGDTAYFFRCSAESTRKLIQELGLEKVGHENDDFFVAVPHWKLERFEEVPDPSEWEVKHQYQRRVSSTGRGHYIITDQSFTQVFVSSDGLGFDSDRELAEEARRMAESR